jgi:polyferredoxin
MKKFKKNWLRHLLQWGTLLAIIIFLTKVFGNKTADPESYCPMGGLESLSTYLVSGSLACSMSMAQIMMGIVLALTVILFSKLFCGYLCPLGWATEYLGKLRAKMKIKEIVIKNGSVLDRILRLVKYALLFILFYFTITNSELFCKNLDPYYAIATGFKGEITLWMAITAIALLVLGSFFIKMFWCKYICPLGAISNIFKFTITFVVLVGIYAILGISGLSISWVYLLAATCLIGYVWESFYLESKVFPLLKVHRNTETCNNCGLCAKKCPYSIDVDKVETVKHVDCTLCGECVASCNQGALTFGKKKGLRWLPAILTIILLAAAFFLGKMWELPTIDVTWADQSKIEQLQKTEIEGLHSVKCYGSSMAFKAQLEKVPGVYGVATYVKKHKAIILYDPSETNPDKIKEAIYTPGKFKIATPPVGAQIKVITIYTEKMYDKMDPNYLGMQFRLTKKGYYGLETEYSCPLTVRLYMDVNEPVDESFIKSIVEMKELAMPAHDGETNIIKVDYKYEGMSDQIDTISRREFLERQMYKFDKTFKDNYEKWGGKDEAVYEIVYENLDKPIITRYIPYLASHLSMIDGFLGLAVVLNDNEDYAFRITYSKAVLDDDKIWAALTQPKWKVKSKDGEISETDPKFSFETKGHTIVIKPNDVKSK